MSEEHPANNLPAQKRVYIVGSQQLQNSVLAKFIAGAAEDIICQDIQSLGTIKEEDLVNNEVLFLIDFNSDDIDDTVKALDDYKETDAVIHVALFNYGTDEDLERYAGRPFISGAFQKDCPQEHLIKGISAIFDGEVWLPRKVLSEYMIKNRNFNRSFNVADSDLTEREVEVLRVMATGAKNTEIAETLNLSPHTVKTHIYNIFKKIKASNRLQAVNWAQQNL